MTSYMYTSKYNPLLNIQHDADRGAASGRGLVVSLRRFSHAPICFNEVRLIKLFCPNVTYDREVPHFNALSGVIHCEYRHN